MYFQGLFDYEVDSDDEWVEEEPGESVSSDEVWSSSYIPNTIPKLKYLQCIFIKI